jgi:alkanesulfonate monooxygenase SsuD/methylene tetrahydromethanopterin reductase-like flavin-dependent oxidoreductase (luciferase family)
MTLSRRIVARFLEREGYGTPHGWEYRKEKDEAVLVNLPPHLQGLWKKNKNLFKGTPERRLEQFQEYVHNLGERETTHFIQEEADNQLERMIKEYEHRPPPEDEYEVPFAG